MTSGVRLARLSDVPAIRDCYLRSWRVAYDGHLPPDVLDEEIEKRRSFDWARGIQADTSIVLVSPGAGDTVVGVAQVDEEPPPPRVGPEVVMLYVDPEVWGPVSPGSSWRLAPAGLRTVATSSFDCESSKTIDVPDASTSAKGGGWRPISPPTARTSPGCSGTAGC